MDAPSDDDVRTLVESARDEDVIERRRWNLVVNRHASFSISWTGQELDVLSRGLRVMGLAYRSRAAFPPAEVSLE